MCFSDGASHQCLLEEHYGHGFAIVKTCFDLSIWADSAGDWEREAIIRVLEVAYCKCEIVGIITSRANGFD
jgi:hypothetical protein